MTNNLFLLRIDCCSLKFASLLILSEFFNSFNPSNPWIFCSFHKSSSLSMWSGIFDGYPSFSCQDDLLISEILFIFHVVSYLWLYSVCFLSRWSVDFRYSLFHPCIKVSLIVFRLLSVKMICWFLKSSLFSILSFIFDGYPSVSCQDDLFISEMLFNVHEIRYLRLI